MSDVLLYRCPTPTNVLCPCGAVARRLKKLEVEHQVERVPYARGRRPEIEELTRQTRVPVLVDGDEVIHDSKRILEYLEWRYTEPEEDETAEDDDEAAERDDRGAEDDDEAAEGDEAAEESDD
jgi:glutathione S-transferase